MKDTLPYTTIKINKTTRRKLKLLALRNDCTMIEMMDKLVEQEEKKDNERNEQRTQGISIPAR